jgi:DNA-binding LytR/AlgR family response regulator
MHATALIAEDEPILAEALALQLQQLWPELTLLPTAMDGDEVVERAVLERPDILFMDIRMPGRNGLDAAEAIAEGWPDDAPLPLLVFVTAYDEHAISAFERHAVDYVLKPVQTERLASTCDRLQRLLSQRMRQATDASGDEVAADDADDAGMDAALDAADHLSDVGSEAALDALRELQTHDGRATTQRLRVLQVAVGTMLKFVPVDTVLYFEAADKYVRVVTSESRHVAGAELLLRTPLRELIHALDPDRFWQIHRGFVVQIDAIDKVTRVNGKLRVQMRGQEDTLEVSRMFTHRFRAM